MLVETGERLAVGLRELPVERAPIRLGEVDPRGQGVAGDLPETAGRGLQDEVVARPELSRERGRKQTRAVPALGSLVHQQDHAVG